VISPFAPGVDFPLRGDVRRLLGAWRRRGELERKVVLDVGCGRGDGLALFAGRVGLAGGIDISPRMLDLSERFLKARGVVPARDAGRAGLRRVASGLRGHAAGKQTLLVQADMGSLAPLRHSADVVLAISSISPTRPGIAPRVFDAVASCLKPGGTLLAVLASLDAFHYLVALAGRRGVALPDAGRVDAHGMFHENGERQKFFTPVEIEQLCERSGLRRLALEKVRYPWPLVRRFGWGFFPGAPRLWDWYLVARARR
jgi:SAM-dependent methyltransferase